MLAGNPNAGAGSGIIPQPADLASATALQYLEAALRRLGPAH
jgi:hypothetical protein